MFHLFPGCAARLCIVDLNRPIDITNRFSLWTLETEKLHTELHAEARQCLEKGKDWPVEGKIWICSVWWHTAVGDEALERCPCV